MSRVTLKSSTIFISVGEKTEVYHSVAEVPPPLRKKLEQSTNGINSATILIADSKGKEEIIRAIRGMPSNLRSQFGAAAQPQTESAAELRCSMRRCGAILVRAAFAPGARLRGLVSFYGQVALLLGLNVAEQLLAHMLRHGCIRRDHQNGVVAR